MFNSVKLCGQASATSDANTLSVTTQPGLLAMYLWQALEEFERLEYSYIHRLKNLCCMGRKAKKVNFIFTLQFNQLNKEMRTMPMLTQ